ncbi:MAG: DNA repair protein RadA [Actinomycetaceae bacterium]|nr:DNA repair protein RadA [Actinomycetaceae bacterium]
MAKDRATYHCSECGWTSAKWLGQCRQCQAWGSLEEIGASEAALPSTRTPARAAVPISTIKGGIAQHQPTGAGEFDRVLGGGLVAGAVVLLAGEPGVGKSTLLLDIAARMAADTTPDAPVLYITGEESSSQVQMRAARIGALHDNLYLTDENDLATILGHIEATSPSFLLVDSVQTIQSSSVEGGAGGTTQVRAVASALIRVAKTRNLPVILVGHVTKDGGIAGPRVLEHLVDVVCQFEGDRHSRLRLLRAVKNRYGPTDEVGCFELDDAGIHGLPDPSGLFLSHTSKDTSGSCVTVTLEGRRPMPTEIQALTSHGSGGSPRRTTSGVDHSRVAMILAVLEARAGTQTANLDVYVSTVGGARTQEPAVDLATAIAVKSAAAIRPVRPGCVVIGELGLSGDVRACTGLQRRLQEAARLGFTMAVIPAQGSEELRAIPGIDIMPVSDLSTAIRVTLGLG